MIPACPDWRALTAHRRDPLLDEPAGWTEALAHLDGCPACRRAALEADPTLLFRRLPALPPPVLDLSPAAEAAEVERVRLAVASLQAARRLAPPREGFARYPRFRRWAAAAVLACAALSLGSTHPLRTGGVRVSQVRQGSVPRPVSPLRLPAPSVTPRFASERVPMVEPLDRPARVYQMDGGENLSVVMIVDERLDV